MHIAEVIHEVDQLTDPVDAAWVRKFLTWFPRFHQVPLWYIDGRIQDGARVPYRTSRPVTALPMIMRWISDVPSKMVKLSGVATCDQDLSSRL